MSKAAKPTQSMECCHYSLYKAEVNLACTRSWVLSLTKPLLTPPKKRKGKPSMVVLSNSGVGHAKAGGL
jgi:hypothetical protein